MMDPPAALGSGDSFADRSPPVADGDGKDMRGERGESGTVEGGRDWRGNLFPGSEAQL